jgi:hypothetical protein
MVSILLALGIPFLLVVIAIVWCVHLARETRFLAQQRALHEAEDIVTAHGVDPRSERGAAMVASISRSRPSIPSR